MLRSKEECASYMMIDNVLHDTSYKIGYRTLNDFISQGPGRRRGPGGLLTVTPPPLKISPKSRLIANASQCYISMILDNNLSRFGIWLQKTDV